MQLAQALHADAGAAGIAAHWLGDQAAFALGDGTALFFLPTGETRRVAASAGGVLCATAHPDGQALLLGDDEGKLIRVASDSAEVFSALGRKWIDHIVTHAGGGVIAAAQGKEAVVFKPGAREPSHRFTYPSSLGGLAFDPKGRRLAASHYGGATLRYALIADDKGTSLVWAGSHLAITISPDAEFVITALQENGLHGWRLPDKLDLRMSGYPSKTRSFSWDRRGKRLATSGANAAVLWPFAGKIGPQGKAPTTLGVREAMASCVAFHPREDWLAVGYQDGAALVAHVETGQEHALRDGGEGPIVSLAWSARGDRLALCDEAGACSVYEAASLPAAAGR